MFEKMCTSIDKNKGGKFFVLFSRHVKKWKWNNLIHNEKATISLSLALTLLVAAMSEPRNKRSRFDLKAG